MLHSVKNWIQGALVIAALPLLAACASGPTYESLHASEPTLATDLGRIYLYRDSTMVGSAVQPSIKLDGTVIGDSQPGGYFYVDRAAGTYEISTTTEKKEAVTLTLTPGQTRYVRFDVSMGLFVGHVLPSLIEPEQAIKEIKDCHFIGSKGT